MFGGEQSSGDQGGVYGTDELALSPLGPKVAEQGGDEQGGYVGANSEPGTRRSACASEAECAASGVGLGVRTVGSELRFAAWLRAAGCAAALRAAPCVVLTHEDEQARPQQRPTCVPG